MSDRKLDEINSLERVELDEFVEHEYKDYQIYTLNDRAIPYLADGLKPAQRRILYILNKHSNKGLTKVSSATGLVLHLHPHGPASVESSIVNMAQDYTFANNYPLIDKKGYFGERMETAPAASRYIECKISEVAKKILFDDMNQIEMIDNYDQKAKEPKFLLPKLPIMLLNGAEGIGTGFSSLIPSYNHNDIIKSMISYINTGKVSKVNPWVDNYNGTIKYNKEKDSYSFELKVEKIKDKYYITELPRNCDAKKIYKHLGNLIDNEIIKDYTDNTVKNNVMIELIFKRGARVNFEKLKEQVKMSNTLSPQLTLIEDEGVRIFTNVEDIIQLFTDQRLHVVKRRYELLIEDAENRIKKNNEIIRFIKQKHYAQAERKKDRAAYITYLKSKKFVYFDYLADMSIYRMTKDEVKKRELLVKEDSSQLKEYKKIVKSPKNIKGKLIEELEDVKEFLTNFLKKKNRKK